MTVTLKNKIGGADRKFTISPNVGSLSFSGNSSWGVDVLNTGGKTMTLYKVASGNSEKMKITVNSWGGSKVESSNTGIVKVSGSAEQSVDAATYQLVTTGFGTATLTFTNRVDPTKNVTYNVTVNSFSAPTLNSSSVTLKSVPRNEGSSNLSATVTVTSPVGGYEVSSGTNSSIASYSMSGNNCTVKAVKAGSTSITFRNKLDASKTAAYNVSVTGILYEGEPVWKYYGLYIAPRNAASNMQWNSSLNNSYCANKEGGTWHVPSRDEWRTILGNSDSATESVWKEYLNKRIFANEYYWSTTDAGSGKAYAMFRLMAGEMSVDVLEKNYLSGAVRCIAR